MCVVAGLDAAGFGFDGALGVGPHVVQVSVNLELGSFMNSPDSRII